MSSAEFRDCEGVSEEKLKRYGGMFLDAIAEFLQQNPSARDVIRSTTGATAPNDYDAQRRPPLADISAATTRSDIGIHFVLLLITWFAINSMPDSITPH